MCNKYFHCSYKSERDKEGMIRNSSLFKSFRVAGRKTILLSHDYKWDGETKDF